ncbi:MAG: hypothetical protein A2293_13440 [Elusimicrobia bacterium RIFOXYB2_FULL_49_7]|nr:MAG: hypothetical protein A2293_13440 [Elusimicrobia bacterium RIFOXYB2_FULL_49_7]
MIFPACPLNEVVLKSVFLLLAGLLFYTWVAYPILLYVWAFFFRRKRKMDESARPSVTLIIPAHNEEACIEKKIRNALELDYPTDKLEIIVASDHSSDQTAARASVFGNRGVRVLDYRERAGKMGTLNKAVKEAKGEILVLTDANALFPSYTIKELVKHFADERVGLVSGAKIIRNLESDSSTGLGESGYWKYESFIKQGESLSGSCSGADGSVYAVRKALYPFPPDKRIIMDDFAVSLMVVKAGYECIYEPQARAFEESSSGMCREFRRKGRIFAGALSFLFLQPAALFSNLFVKLISHKILRWLTFLFQILLFGVSFLLSSHSMIRPIFGFQAVFYASALAGALLNHFSIRLLPFHIPYYFNMTTFAQGYGFWYYFKNGRRPQWEKLR